MKKLSDAAQAIATGVETLRNNARTVEDIRTWLLQHGHILGEVPEYLLPRLTVSVEVDSLTLHELVTKNTLWATVIFKVPNTEPKNPLEEVFRLVRDNEKSLYWRHYHMPLGFKEWPLCTAWLVHALFDKDTHESNYAPIKEKLSYLLNKFFPSMPLDVLESMHHAGLLPEDRDALTDLLFDTRPTALSNICLPDTFAPR